MGSGRLCFPQLINWSFAPRFTFRSGEGLSLSISNRNLPGIAIHEFGYRISTGFGLWKSLVPIEALSNALLLAEKDGRTDLNMWEKLVSALDIRISLSGISVDEIPHTGPLVIVANHPLAGVDGIAIAATISKVRPDLKVILDSIFENLSAVRDFAFFAERHNTPERNKCNAMCVVNATHWLKDGGAILIFPAGETSYSMDGRAPAQDPPWVAGIEFLIRNSEAQVLPIYVEKDPPQIFQVARRLGGQFWGDAYALNVMSAQIGTQIPLRIRPFLSYQTMREWQLTKAAFASRLQQITTGRTPEN